jgi:hypothetical protein
MPEMPEMPKPEDFGITDEDWANYLRGNERGIFYSHGGYAKVEAYHGALEAWKGVAKAAASRGDSIKRVHQSLI